MFLAELQDNEKEAFLELASLIGTSDGKLSIYESTIIERYQKEMDNELYKMKHKSYEDALKSIPDSKEEPDPWKNAR